MTGEKVVSGIGGTPEVPYMEDTEYWVRWLHEVLKDDFITDDVVAEIRSAPNMLAARAIAQSYYNKLLECCMR